MKKMLFLFTLLLMVSCNTNYAPEKNVLDNESFYFFDGGDKINYSKNLLEEKFKEFYDLNILLKKYPDFKDDIEKRIKKFTSNPEFIFNLNDS